MKGKYPLSLFLIGFFLNILRMWWLVLAAVILMVVGIWQVACLYIGIGILAVVLFFSLVQQLIYRHIVLTCKNPELSDFQQAVLNGNWRGDVSSLLEKSIKDQIAKTDRYLSLTSEEMAALADDEICEAAFARADHRVDSFDSPEKGFDSLNAAQRVIYALFLFEMEVNNGGLCQFFVNSSRVVAPYISEYMAIIGAFEHKTLFDTFVSGNQIDLTELSSFDIEEADEFEEQTKRYPFDEYDDAFYDQTPLEDDLKKYARAHAGEL